MAVVKCCLNLKVQFPFCLLFVFFPLSGSVGQTIAVFSAMAPRPEMTNLTISLTSGIFSHFVWNNLQVK
jgi:hypothetical protein